MYRPDNWKKPYMVPTPSLLDLSTAERTDATRHLMNDAYEAGADAMLEALKKEGKYIDASKYPYGMVLNEVPPIQKLTRKFKGYILIIPDKPMEV